MYKLNVISEFSSAHRLTGYAGACKNLHGHNWKVRVGINAAETDAIGMTLDFGIVKQHLSEIISQFDHQYLNDLEYFQEQNPTSENIARVLFDELSRRLNQDKIRVCEVEVWESERSSLVYFE